MISLGAYYSRRAEEYESIYRRDDPVRQQEQSAIAAAMTEALRNRDALEVACGTGYWSGVLATVVKSLVAVDISEEMLAIAQAKQLPADRVRFKQGNAYALGSDLGMFDGGVANFWFSHVPRAHVSEFLQGFHARLLPGARVFLADNVHVPGIGGELVTRAGVEDTFKLRTLADGSHH